MKYIALLRGINVGGNNKVEMKRLKIVLEGMGYINVSTYLNSGNALFESEEKQDQIQANVPKVILKEFGLEIPTLIKNIDEIKRIASIIPPEWQNDKDQKTDVAYLFTEINSEETISELPIKREYVDLIYVEGAIVWHVTRDNYNNSQLNKLVGSKLYKQMTVRNVNTARFLAGVIT